MPRLLPRLIEKLKVAPITARKPRPLDKGGYTPRKTTSAHQPVLDEPSFDARGRTQSILLDHMSPVTHRHLYLRRKTHPPRVHASEPTNGQANPLREMTTHEREWWSSPYFRMLSRHIRRCTVSQKYLPTDFLIRLVALQVPVPRGSKPVKVWMPDGLQHPKFKRRKGHRAMYITCWKDMFSPDNLNRVYSPHAANAIFHKHLAKQIEHDLRMRIIQELQMLTKALSRRPKKNEPAPTILRRLTRAEFKELRETGAIPHQDAVAVLIVPPVNRDPITKVKPIPSLRPEIIEGEQGSSARLQRRPLPPLSTMLGTRLESSQELELSVANLVPDVQVPLYHGLSMFPSASQRAVLHKSLCEVLGAERRYRSGKSSNTSNISSDDKGSHAFLLVSNERTVKWADSVALSIALWRLRMWQGDAYQSQFCSGGWEVDGEWRMRYVQAMG